MATKMASKMAPKMAAIAENIHISGCVIHRVVIFGSKIGFSSSRISNDTTPCGQHYREQDGGQDGDQNGVEDGVQDGCHS
jgi:hypothetical protein